MAGKKKPGRSTSTGPNMAIPPAVVEASESAYRLIQARRFDEAVNLLRDLDRRVPNTFTILAMLSEAAYGAREMVTFLDVAERLALLSPNDPEVQAQRAFAFAANGYPILAKRQFQQVIARWPDHPKAEQVRKTLADLEDAYTSLRADMESQGIAPADMDELGARHEQVQVFLQRGKFAESRRVAQQLLARWPNFPAAHNNIAECWYREGNLAQALAATRQALAIAPDNAHAHGNLAMFLFLDRKPDEARATAAQFASLPVRNPANRVKLAETLALLGDEAGILDIFAAAEQIGFQVTEEYRAHLYHLAAVAAYRLGDEKRARELWAGCLNAVPMFELARHCIDDLDRPIGEQNGPWFTHFESSLPHGQLRDLVPRILEQGAASCLDRTREEVRRFLKQNPHFSVALEMQLDRGPAVGRELAIRVAGIARTPELLDALPAFARGQRGKDRQRIEAAFVLAQTGRLPNNEARLWLHGQWQTKKLPNCEITNELVGEKLTGRVKQLMAQSQAAMTGGDLLTAEQLMCRARSEMPGVASITYNLGSLLLGQGRRTEAEELFAELRRDRPDYLFGILQEARDRIAVGEKAEAKALIEQIASRPAMHASEFFSLATAQIELAMTESRREDAQFWVALLEAVSPLHPQLPQVRKMAGMKA